MDERTIDFLIGTFWDMDLDKVQNVSVASSRLLKSTSKSQTTRPGPKSHLESPKTIEPTYDLLHLFLLHPLTQMTKQNYLEIGKQYSSSTLPRIDQSLRSHHLDTFRSMPM
eukprot:scaffold33611_cov39-Attheya_sp.AAC.2